MGRKAREGLYVYVFLCFAEYLGIFSRLYWRVASQKMSPHTIEPVASNSRRAARHFWTPALHFPGLWWPLVTTFRSLFGAAWYVAFRLQKAAFQIRQYQHDCEQLLRWICCKFLCTNVRKFMRGPPFFEQGLKGFKFNPDASTWLVDSVCMSKLSSYCCVCSACLCRQM